MKMSLEKYVMTFSSIHFNGDIFAEKMNISHP